MLQSLTCSRGHQWRCDVESLVSTGQTSAVCPDCGAEVTLDEHGLEATLDHQPWSTSDSTELRRSQNRSDHSRRFTVIRTYARGGLGLVSLAEDHELQRTVVLKEIREDRLEHPYARERFLNEAKITGQLEHPGIAPIYALEHDERGNPFYAMRFLQGRTLREAIADYHDQPRPAEFNALLNRFVSICQTIAYAHSMNVIHRDLKPVNVLLGDFGETVVLDWGLAKRLDRPSPSPQQDAAANETASNDIERPAELTDSPSGRNELTTYGDVLGTPAYMPPEQAGGRVDRLDQRADVFGLGGILCEILTNEPPYRGDTVAELLDRARRAELGEVNARLDGCRVDDDLVQLAKCCLAPDPSLRPRSAAEVAERVSGYLTEVQERLHTAEVEGAAARTRVDEERKRRRVTVALAALLLLFVLAMSAGALWYQRDQAARTIRRERLLNDVSAALREATQRGDKAWALADDPYRWEAELTSALSAAGRAEALLANLASETAQRQQLFALKNVLEAQEKDREMVATLERIRIELSQPDVTESRFSVFRAPTMFRAAFEDYGIARTAMDPAEAANVIRTRREPIRGAMIAALDEWLLELPADGAGTSWLRAVATAADRDDWRSQVREEVGGVDTLRLERLAREVDCRRQPPASLVLLGRVLHSQRAHDSAQQLMLRAQAQYPHDLWINIGLAKVLADSRPIEAVGFYRIAIALRPRNAGVYLNYGNALKAQGNLKGAVDAYQRAIEINGNYAVAYVNLGNTLVAQNDPTGAFAAFGTALEIDPDLALAHSAVGGALMRSGNLDDAVKHLRRAIEIEPTHALTHNNLGNALKRQGQIEGAIAAYYAALEHDPNYALAYSNLGTALKAQADVPGAVAAYRKAIELDPKSALAHYNLGNLLRAQNDLPGAIAAYRQALSLDPEYAEASCNMGFALRNQGRLAEALDAFRAGHEASHARPDWRYPSERWLRSAERLVELDKRIPQFLSGEEKISDGGLLIEYAQLCYYKRSFAAVAQCYREAFIQEPELAKDLNKSHRYNAACAAALAGTTGGDGGESMNDSKQLDLRKEALGWLRADLDAWSAAAQKFDDKPDRLAHIKSVMNHWKGDPDLFAVREESELAKLDAAERKAFRRLWADVADLFTAVSSAEPIRIEHH